MTAKQIQYLSCGVMGREEEEQAGGNKTTWMTYVIHHCTNARNCWNLAMLLFLLLLPWVSCLHISSPPSFLLPYFTGFPFASKLCDFSTLIPSHFLAWNSAFLLLLDMVHLNRSLVNLPSIMQLPNNCSLNVPIGKSGYSQEVSGCIQSPSPRWSTLKKCTYLSYHNLTNQQNFLCITIKQPDLYLTLY